MAEPTLAPAPLTAELHDCAGLRLSEAATAVLVSLLADRPIVYLFHEAEQKTPDAIEELRAAGIRLHTYSRHLGGGVHAVRVHLRDGGFAPGICFDRPQPPRSNERGGAKRL